MTWDKRYVRLNEGDIIQEGDELEVEDYKTGKIHWLKVSDITIGTPVPNPNYTSHRIYRRKTSE